VVLIIILEPGQGAIGKKGETYSHRETSVKVRNAYCGGLEKTRNHLREGPATTQASSSLKRRGRDDDLEICKKGEGVAAWGRRGTDVKSERNGNRRAADWIWWVRPTKKMWESASEFKQKGRGRSKLLGIGW